MFNFVFVVCLWYFLLDYNWSVNFWFWGWFLGLDIDYFGFQIWFDFDGDLDFLLIFLDFFVITLRVLTFYLI